MKAVLVIDMPKNCGDCILANEDYDVCQATQKSISYGKRGYGFECPLKPMPKEKEVPFADKLMFITELSKKDMYSIGKAEGWNTCIDEIVGKEKQNGKK